MIQIQTLTMSMTKTTTLDVDVISLSCDDSLTNDVDGRPSTTNVAF